LCKSHVEVPSFAAVVNGRVRQGDIRNGTERSQGHECAESAATAASDAKYGVMDALLALC
jgi:hypothetical protein